MKDYYVINERLLSASTLHRNNIEDENELKWKGQCKISGYYKKAYLQVYILYDTSISLIYFNDKVNHLLKISVLKYAEFKIIF